MKERKGGEREERTRREDRLTKSRNSTAPRLRPRRRRRGKKGGKS